MARLSRKAGDGPSSMYERSRPSGPSIRAGDHPREDGGFREGHNPAPSRGSPAVLVDWIQCRSPRTFAGITHVQEGLQARQEAPHPRGDDPSSSLVWRSTCHLASAGIIQGYDRSSQRRPSPPLCGDGPAKATAIGAGAYPAHASGIPFGAPASAAGVFSLH